MLYEDVRLDGHIIDSLMLPQVLDDILALGGDYRILDFPIGHARDDVSTAVLRVEGRDRRIWTTCSSGSSGTVPPPSTPVTRSW